MKFGTSEGMVTAASTHGAPAAQVFVITADEGAVPGQRVH
jgi:tRNA-binding EMAP/Myf-like protein